MTLVISNCSKRKRIPLDSALQARNLEAGPTQTVASRWADRLVAATAATPVKDIYGGRAFVEATEAARLVRGPLLIVSAGLGLVDAETAAPGYSLTTTRRDPDCVLDKIPGDAAMWWRALQTVSPIRSTALETETGLILAALPSAYLAMVADDWSGWPEERLQRLRLFTKEAPIAGSAALRSAWMPYDDRLDFVDPTAGGTGGTQGDFAQRALKHFAGAIGGGDRAHDRAAVLSALEGKSVRQIPVRRRLADEAITAIIDRDWSLVRGRSTPMLRRLRDDLLVSCEQGRFQGLFNAVAARRAQEERT